MSDLWTEATHDAEAEARTLKLETAKHASSGTWTFLAQARSEQEYADRVALASEAITAVASAYDVPVDMLLSAFDHRFALLMEAGGFPFGNDSQDDSGDDSKESKDDDSDDDHDESDDDDDDDHDESDDDDDDSDDDNGDGHKDDTDDDTDSDDTGDGDDEDNNDNSGNAPPWAAKMSALINSGANPLTWGDAAPFVRSSARDNADGADPVTDTTQQPTGPQGPSGSQGPDGNRSPDAPGDTDVPDPTAEDEGAQPTLPGMDGGIAETTKPRQLPEGDGGIPGMDQGLTGEFDPDTNGGDIEQGADSDLPGQPDNAEKTAALAQISPIFFEVKKYNPHLTGPQCYKIARQVYDTYLHKHADDVNPLLYGDRGPVADGPLTNAIKNWSPTDMKGPKTPGGGPTPPKPTTSPTTGGTGATGEAAAATGEAADLLPLLAL